MNNENFDSAVAAAGETGKPSESWLAAFKQSIFQGHHLRKRMCIACKAPESLHGSNPAKNPLRPDTGSPCEEFRPQQ